MTKKPHLEIVRPSTAAERETRTTLDCIVVTPGIVRSWKLPGFQRELRVNAKVMEVVELIQSTQIIPGVLTLGVLNKQIYLIDGQHRREAFLLSGEDEAFVDVRYAHFDSMAEMSEEFVRVNTPLVGMKPDDVLRGHEDSNENLRRIRRECPWIGYGNIRRSPTSPIVSMSAALRCWFGSAPEVPSFGGLSALRLVEIITPDETTVMLGFMRATMTAWGREADCQRLWLNLNLTICMWMYRRLVITPYSSNIRRMESDMFTKCLMTVGASNEHHSWLLGRQMRERDRGPTYQRLKSMSAQRVEAETGIKPRLPQPSWGGR